jgi:hypothetical protein
MGGRQTSVVSFFSAPKASRLPAEGFPFLNIVLDTDNVINTNNGGYEHVSEYIPIGQPNAGTLAKLDALKPSTVIGDRALISFNPFHSFN